MGGTLSIESPSVSREVSIYEKEGNDLSDYSHPALNIINTKPLIDGFDYLTQILRLTIHPV